MPYPNLQRQYDSSFTNKVTILRGFLAGYSNDQILLDKITEKIQELSNALITIPRFTTNLATNRAIYQALSKLKQHQFEAINKEKASLQLYTPLLGRSDFNSKDRFDVMKKVTEFIKSPNKTRLLLCGDAGSGKTTFAYYLAQEWWKTYQHFNPDEYVPIVIPLITITDVNDVKTNLIGKYFSKCELKQEEINLLQKYAKFLFIVEGYEEKGVIDDLYKSNSLDKWKCKEMTCCRSQVLLNKFETIRSLFVEGNEPLNLIAISPFEVGEIKLYLTRYFQEEGKYLSIEMGGGNQKPIDVIIESTADHYFNILLQITHALSTCQ